MVLALFGRESLAEDVGVSDGASGFSALTLACNHCAEAEVDTVMREADAAGARIVTPAGKVFWGGYRGKFTDPGGHIWEVAYNPLAPIDAEGRVKSTG